VYDSGGLALKPAGSMYGMHGDKSGAAVVMGVLQYYGRLARTAGSTGLAFNLVGLLPMVENAVSETAVRPGDIVRAYDGNTVEIVDPDSEGRLILADVLASCARFKPAHVIDVATLTGTAESMHADVACAYYTSDEAMAALVRAAGERVGERAWRMPPWPEYAERTGSAVATYKNAGYDGVGGAGGFMAAMFLYNFVPAAARATWLHLDISHTDVPGTPYMTGTGLLMLIDIVERLSSSVSPAPAPTPAPGPAPAPAPASRTARARTRPPAAAGV
jgi:leucyl aminopeptidase